MSKKHVSLVMWWHLTSRQIGVRLVCSQKHGLPRLQHDTVQEVNGKASDVPRILGMQPEQQFSMTRWGVSACSLWNKRTGQTSFITIDQTDAIEPVLNSVLVMSWHKFPHLPLRFVSPTCWADPQTASSHSSSFWWNISSERETFGPGLPPRSGAPQRLHYRSAHGTLGHLKSTHQRNRGTSSSDQKHRLLLLNQYLKEQSIKTVNCLNFVWLYCCY